MHPAPMLPRLALWQDFEPQIGPRLMAADELLLSSAMPVLRIYHWAERSVSIGYTGSAVAAAAFAHGRPWVRRWTGGGLVEHGSDWTLALAVPGDSLPTRLRLPDWYAWIHGTVREALKPDYPEIEAASPSGGGGPVCFTSPVCGDLVMTDRKILGGALRKTRTGVLYQGSLDLSLPDPDRTWHSVASRLAETVVEWRPSDDWDSRVESLAQSRYQSAEWRARRP